VTRKTEVSFNVVMDALSRLIRSLAIELLRALEGSLNVEVVDSLTARTDMVLRAAVSVISSHPRTDVESCVVTLQKIVHSLNNILSSSLDNCEPYGYHLPLTFTGERGKPKIGIPESMLKYMLSSGFSATKISMLLQVSLSTVQRRMSEFGITVREGYSAIGEDELDRIITLLQHQNPNCGYRMMQGYLARLGHKVQQTRIRESMARTDPEGVLSRWFGSIRRRTYHVSSPNALWHIDGHHKLIRYTANYFLNLFSYCCFESLHCFVLLLLVVI